MGIYLFRIYDIDWCHPLGETNGLPEEVVITLPGWLVESSTIDDDEWDEMIKDELREQFGGQATGFSFEPYEEDEPDDS